MRTSRPRIAPLSDAELDEDQRQALAPVSQGRAPLNIYRTLVRAPKALTRFLEWGTYVLSRRNSVPARLREIVILRVGFLCRSGYEFAQHSAIGRREGLTEAEIAAIKTGAGASNWTPTEAALIRAADELVANHFISDPAWAALEKHFDEKQRMDLVFTIGQYVQVSMFLNSFGVPLEAGQVLDPDIAAAVNADLASAQSSR